ncbi:MAG: sulfotransferase domain-containing protein [Planctomycetota bacterium]
MKPEPDSPLTIVSGLPRSGTSLMMQLLAAGGLEPLTDQLRTPDQSNPRGYFEYEPVKSLARDQSWLPEARGKVVKIIVQLLDYLPPELPVRTILLERDLDEVLASQAKMLNKSIPPAQWQTLKETFRKHWEQARQTFSLRPESSLIVVNYRELVTSPETVIERLARFLAPADLRREKMLAAIDPALYRNRVN